MSISIQFLNDATRQPAVYLDRTDLDKFTLSITTDSAAPVAVPSVRIRLPVKIFAVGQAARVTVDRAVWGEPVAAGPFLTLTPTAPLSVSSAAPLVIGLGGVAATATVATNDDVQVFVGSEAPTAKIFLMRYPAEGDLTRVLKPVIDPGVVYRTPSDFSRVENVLALRLINLDPRTPLITAPWVRKPAVRLSFVYGNDIGSLTPADPPVSDPHSAFNIAVDVYATYKDGARTYEWSSTPPETGATDASPVWTLQPVPENPGVLGAGSGATAEFRISGLSTAAPAGSTLAYLQFSDFPGYSDTYMSVPLSKVEPQPAVVYFDGVPNYVAALGDSVTLEWQTFAMARVELQAAGKTLDGPLDAARGTRAVPIDRTTDFALLAYKKDTDTTPAHSPQWTAHVPDARITSFTADRTTVADGSPVVLSWATGFARAAEIAGDTRYSIPAAALAAGTRTYYPRRPTTYTLQVTGQGDPPGQQLSVFVLKRGWSVRPMGFSPEAGQGPVLYGTDAGLVLVGGQSDNAVFQSADGAQWDQVGVAAFPARNDAAGCAFGGKLWIMGGVLGNGRPGNDVWSSADGITWTQATAAAAWPARSSFACAEFGGKLWIFGGRDQNFQPLGDIWWSADGVAWTQVTAGPPRWKPRSGAAVAVHGGKLWLFGGQLADRSLNGDLWSSADGTTWSVESSGGMLGDGPEPRQGATLASLGGGALYLFGGVSATGAALDDFQLFDGGWDLGTGPSNWNISRAGFATWRGAFWFAGGRNGNAASDAVWSWFSEQGS